MNSYQPMYGFTLEVTPPDARRLIYLLKKKKKATISIATLVGQKLQTRNNTFNIKKLVKILTG